MTEEKNQQPENKEVQEEKSDKPNTEQERTTLAKQRFLEAFEERMGVISYACSAAEVGRTTYYDWIAKDEEFKKEVDRILVMQLDVVEERLLELISKNKEKSIHFYLSRKHPSYRPKREHSGSIKTDPYAGYTKEQLEERIRELKDSREAIERGDKSGGSDKEA